MSPSFEDFCKFLDALSKSKTNEKKILIKNYVKKWKNNYGPNLFDFVRLLYPKGDDERKYNLKEDRLANVLIKALVMDPQSSDGIRLKQYKIPSSVNLHAGNFSMNAFQVIKKRSLVTRSEQTIKETNEYLDKLTNRDADQVALFKEILNKYTAQQIEWIIRIILKDLKIHCGDRLVLDAIHEGGYEKYMENRCLRDISDITYHTTSDNKGIKLFNTLAPQLAQQYSPELFEKFNKPFYSEVKLDGERVIMHYDKEQDRFFWHSKNGNSQNDLYGSSSKDMNKLSGHIHRGILSKKIILDGEMVAYDPKTKILLPFGTLRNSVKSQNINDPTLPHPSYRVFDILMYDGIPLVDHRLEERISALKSTVKDQGMHLKLLERKELETKEQVCQELDLMWLKQEEGLILKDKNSAYRLNRRSTRWLKYKSQYASKHAGICDLLVVGAKYGSGRRGGKLTSILFAVRDDRVRDTESPRFATFTLGANGLNDGLIRDLENRMKNVTDHDPKKMPDWLIHPTKNGESFDKVIGYQDSIVMAVSGMQIVNSTKFGVDNTIRFPVCLELKHDKGWQSIMYYSEVLKAKEEGSVGIKREAESQLSKSNSKKLNTTQLLPSQRGLDSSQLKEESNIFQGKVFYVISGTKLNDYEPIGILKDDLDAMIKTNGGEYIQNKDADFLIAGVYNSTVDSIINVIKERDILFPSYISDCIDAKRMLPISPKYMFYTSPNTQMEFLKTMDIYGDYYSRKLLAKDMIQIMDNIKVDTDKDDSYYRELSLEVTHRYVPEGISGMMFLNIVAYFDFDTSKSPVQPIPITADWVAWKRCQEEMEIAQHMFEFEAGRVSQNRTDETITHVVMNKHDLTRFEALKKCFMGQLKPQFVVLDWIKMCYDQETLVNEAGNETVRRLSLLKYNV